MQIEVNGELKHIPSDFGVITLGKFIDWQNQHGKALDKELSEVLLKEYDDDLQLEFAVDDHLMREAIAWYSFWTDCDFSDIQKHPQASEMFEQYKLTRCLLKESEKRAESFPATYQWEGEDWVIQNFTVNPQSDMSFNEIVTSKEVLRQLVEMDKGRWDSLPYLACIFLRKKGEPFTDELIYNDGERMKLFKTLPMDIALSVGFFLISCVNIWRQTSQFSKVAEAQIQSQR